MPLAPKKISEWDGPVTTHESVRGGFEHDGFARTFLLHVPLSYTGLTPVPLVLGLHGGTGTGAAFERESGLSALSDARGFIVAYPDALEPFRFWEDGRRLLEPLGINDVTFLAALIDHLSLKGKYNINPDRIYLTGFSSGGMMAHYFAARQADRVAAIAPFCGGMVQYVHDTFAPTSPVSVLELRGTADLLMPFNGGPIFGGGVCVSMDTGIALWLLNGGLNPSDFRVVDIPDSDPNDGVTATSTEWPPTQQPGRVRVVKTVLTNAGHRWTGGGPEIPIFGRSCGDFNAGTTIIDFFEANPKVR